MPTSKCWTESPAYRRTVSYPPVGLWSALTGWWYIEGCLLSSAVPPWHDPQQPPADGKTLLDWTPVFGEEKTNKNNQSFNCYHWSYTNYGSYINLAKNKIHPRIALLLRPVPQSNRNGGFILGITINYNTGRWASQGFILAATNQAVLMQMCWYWTWQ